MRFKQSVTIVFFTLLLGAGLLSFFVILSGGRRTGVLREFYWLEAETDGFNDAPSTTRWFNYDWCGIDSGQLQNCSSTQAAKAFSPQDNFGESSTLPSAFLKDRNTYYYLSRVAWAMLLIGLFYEVCALVPVLISIFSSSLMASFLAVLSLWLAWFFVTLSACLYTGCYVKARNVFSDGGRHAKLGAKNFGLIWTSVALLLACAIWSSVVATFYGMRRLSRNDQEHRHYGLESGVSSDSYGGDKTTLETRDHGAQNGSKFKVFKLWKTRRGPNDAHNTSLAADPQFTASEYDDNRVQIDRSA
ncbi:LADA_0E06480g1_1 [Lachancea dasiensis]|uniref:LADA_0E06480g1_1 n=1 Tax=Lachancea dasiensis TaxID=1072105 RepID=A0A1G4JCP9_9SACH|nr:LADA_0E06480g1_1 [Lachancea dasiensis]